jgi:hypothetical protein
MDEIIFLHSPPRPPAYRLPLLILASAVPWGAATWLGMWALGATWVDSGSGFLIVVSFDSWDQRGHFGASGDLWLWLGWLWWSFEKGSGIFVYFCF